MSHASLKHADELPDDDYSPPVLPSSQDDLYIPFLGA